MRVLFLQLYISTQVFKTHYHTLNPYKTPNNQKIKKQLHFGNCFFNSPD